MVMALFWVGGWVRREDRRMWLEKEKKRKGGKGDGGSFVG